MKRCAISVWIGLALIFLPGTVLAQTTVAGFTPGSFRVTESGAASHTIPIREPPGIAGMEPKLALTYNSQGGNGLLGVGWSLEGLSAISRCPRTLAQDGVRGGVTYETTDRFCLDGRRLVLYSGTYGADGAEYRTELETFSRIISYGAAGNGPAYFKVWTKNGQILEYGNSSDSRIEAKGKSTARVWALNRQSDTVGNYLTLTYTEDTTNGDYYPARIDYGYASGVAGRSVEFSYGTRNDAPPAWVAGSLIKTVNRLTNIKTYVGTALVTDYRLAYDYSSASSRSRVTSIQECDAAGACKPAISAPWTGAGLSYSGVNQTYLDGMGTNYRLLIGDINGDGKSDLVYAFWGTDGLTIRTKMSNGDGTFTPYQWVSGDGEGTEASLHIGDVNGDGKADVIYVLRGTAEQGLLIRTKLSNGDGTFTPIQHVSGDGPDVIKPAVHVADVNGDGRSDVIYTFWLSDGLYVRAKMSNGDGSYTGYSWYGGDGQGTPESSLQFGDVNGDGKADLIYALWGTFEEGLVIRTKLSNGDGTFTPTQHVSGDGVGTRPGFSVGDVNGDGRADLIYTFWLSDGLYIRAKVSNGDGSFTGYSWHGGDGEGTDSSLHVGDVNGDGKTDLIYTLWVDGALKIRVKQSNGDGTFSPFQYESGDGSQIHFALRAADVNGDGRTDMLFIFFDTALNTRAKIVGGGFPDLLASIDNGLGAVTSVTHAPLTNSAVYAKGSGATYPVVDLQAPLYVASSVAESNGIGGGITTNYTYAGLRLSLDGRGSQGFSAITATDAATGLKGTTVFRQDWPFAGQASQVKQARSDGFVLAQADHTYACKDFDADPDTCTVGSGKRYFPYASQSVDTRFDLNGAALPTVTTTNAYDAYGNATSVAVSTGDGYAKTTTNTYTNDTTNWFLGRLTRSTVTSTRP